MRQYQRLMRRSIANTYSTHEAKELRILIEGAPGVTHVELVERHPRGGYRVVFDLSRDSVDAFIAVLDKHDWMSVI